MDRTDLAALGELLIDFTPAGADTFTANPGGAPANVLVAAAKSGCSTAFLGKVGADAFGDRLERTLRENGVSVKALRRSGVHTTLAFVHLSPDGDRSFTFCRNHSADTLLTPEELDRELLASCRVFHLGSLSLTDEPSRSATLEALRLAKESGAKISYDPNWRPSLWADPAYAKESMALPLGFADFVKLSEDEVPLVTPFEEIERGADWLVSRGASLAVVTRGEKGCYYCTAEDSGALPAPTVRAVDTTGSGDVFTGVLLAGLIRRGFSLEREALERDLAAACAAGSLCATRFGGIPAIPTGAEIEAFLNQYGKEGNP